MKRAKHSKRNRAESAFLKSQIATLTELGVRVKDIAKTLGISSSYVSYVKNGYYVPVAERQCKPEPEPAPKPREQKPRRKEIYRYVRDGHNRKVGIVLAKDVNGRIGVGWSKCKVRGKNPDKFDRDLGLTIARARAEKHARKGREYLETHVAQSVKKPLINFAKSAHRYYRGE